jgi:diguanylate cyclase (GGDEF)-like protein
MTQSHDSRRLNLALFYRLSVGGLCTALLAVAFCAPHVFDWSYGNNWLAFSMYIALATIARFFSFEAPERRITLTLDTPVYLASIVSLGEVMGGLACYLSLLGFLTWKTFLQFVVQKDRSEPAIEAIGRLLFAPSMGTALLLGLVTLMDANPDPQDHSGLYRFVLLLGILFVVLQYSLTAVYYVLRGVTWERFFKGVLLPGLVTEMALIPIAILMVLVYDDTDLSPFILLSVIFLFVNYVLRNLSQTSAKLSRQVRELAALNRLGQTICATLERPQLVERIAQETLELFSSADSFLLHWTDETDEKHVDVYDRRGVTPKKFPHDTARMISEEAQTQDSTLQRTTVDGSWVAVPVTVSELRVGSLALWSRSGKGFHPDDVRFLTVVAQQAAIALENARLYELATVDSLTGLYVRRYFDDRLRDEVARIKRYGGRCSLCLLDVDYLKTINDTRSHQAGDAALEFVAHVMRQGTRMVDIPARIGGDEFAILLPNLDITTAQLVSDRLRRQVAKVPVVFDGKEFKVTVSIGVVAFPDPNIDSMEELIAAADQALYQAKCTPGRNRVATNDPAMNKLLGSNSHLDEP